ncbi:MAG TPA: hypothetical protein VF444_23360 [Pseudonocardiaceae bacterium]
MRLVRLGDQTSQVGSDLRAALSSWGEGDSVLGGVALLGVTPVGCGRPVEAIVLTPRGLVVVVGVDLPDPAIRLEAPLNAPWKADNWPLVRSDGVTNPAGAAMRIAGTVSRVLEQARVEPLPVTTVIAVGPYVQQVVQPAIDMHRGVRVLHPRPKSLLDAVRELTTYKRASSVDNARHVLSTVVGVHTAFTPHELIAEGFVDAVTPSMAKEHTTLIPRITDLTEPPDGVDQGGKGRGRAGRRGSGGTTRGRVPVGSTRGTARGAVPGSPRRTVGAAHGSALAASPAGVRQSGDQVLRLLTGEGKTGWTRWLPLGVLVLLVIVIIVIIVLLV